MHDNLEQGIYGENGMPTSPIYSAKVQPQTKYIVCSIPSSQNLAATMALDSTNTLREAKGTVGGAFDVLGAARVAWEATKGMEELKKILYLDQVAAGGAADFPSVLIMATWDRSKNIWKREQRQWHNTSLDKPCMWPRALPETLITF